LVEEPVGLTERILFSREPIPNTNSDAGLDLNSFREPKPILNLNSYKTSVPTAKTPLHHHARSKSESRDGTSTSDYFKLKTTIQWENEVQNIGVPLGTHQTLFFLNRIVRNHPEEPVLNLRVPDFLHVPENGSATLLSNNYCDSGSLCCTPFDLSMLESLLCNWLKRNLAANSLNPLTIFKQA
jgi:hypothetical protein